MSRKKNKLPPNCFRVPDGNYRPQFTCRGNFNFAPLSRKFYELVELTCPKIDEALYSQKARTERVGKNIPDTGHFYPVGVFATLRTADPAIQHCLNGLWERIQVAINSSYNEGTVRGKNLLLGLAGGEITLREMNDSSAKH